LKKERRNGATSVEEGIICACKPAPAVPTTAPALALFSISGSTSYVVVA
jgi:hypothetical protein